MMHKLVQAIRIAVVALLVCSGVALKAQTITANINGTVTDPSGAVIPNAKITATNVDTNISTSTTSNGDGIYNVRFLQVGRYNVTIVAQGFEPFKVGPITLEATQEAKIDGHLVLEGQKQSVAVSAETAPLLNTENDTLATTLDERAIDNIPMVGRNYAELVLYVPGAVVTQPSGFSGNSAIGVGGTQASVNGNREQSNNYLLDGIEINETLNNGVGYNPSPDALGQMQVISANAQAEYGNVNGGDIVALIKSGTNQFHGSGFYYLSNYKLNANTWAAGHVNPPGQPAPPKSSYTQPIFGGTFGGPILHNKLFIFGDYEGGRYHLGTPAGISTTTVITAKMRTGDFSELTSDALMCTTAHPAPCPAQEFQLYDSTNASFTPYFNNQVTIVNPVAKYLFAHPELYPLPNHTVQGNQGSPATGNYTAPSKSRKFNDQYDVKADYKFSQKDSLSVRWSQSNNGSTTTPLLAITFPTAPLEPIHGFAINEIHTLNASMVNEFRAGYMRVHPLGGQPLDTTGAFGANGNSVLGIPGGQAASGFSAQTFNPGSTTGVKTTNGSEYSTLGNSDTATTYVDNSFTYGDTFTWLDNKHTFKFGAQFIRYQQNSLYPGNDGLLGVFAYTGIFTSNQAGTNNPGGYNQQGYSVADFVLDRINYAGNGALPGSQIGPTGMRQWRDAFFGQDDWKITPTLTLNFGVRYEYDQPMYEVNNKWASVDFGTKQLIIAGQNGYSRSLVNPYYGGIMPRVGFSDAITPRLVVRGGYGIQNYMEGTGANRRMNLNPPFTNAYAATAAVPTKTTAGAPFAVEHGFASGGTGAVSSSSNALNAWDMKIRPAFIGEYSLTLEYQVSNTASLKVGYVGESGQHLINHSAQNQLHSPCLLSGGPTGAACAAAVPAPFKALVGQSGSVTLTDSSAMMNYNALQATYRQRAWHGLQYTLNYTYGRAMTNAIGFFGAPGISGANNYNEDAYNNHAEYGPTGEDVRHNISGTMVYDLPFGRGRTFGSHMNRFLDEIVGGWKVTWTAIAYSGFPVTINNSSNNADTANKTQRANWLRPLKVTNRSMLAWFGSDLSAQYKPADTTKGSCATAGTDNGLCAYGFPADGTYGTARVNDQRAPGYQQYNASAAKSFTVYHEQKIEFRTDASNVLNLTSWGNPVNTFQSGTFGQITSVRNGPRQLQLDLKYIF